MAIEKSDPDKSKKPNPLAENPLKGLGAMGEDLLNLGEHFGIERKDVGKAVVKAVFTGKFPDFFEKADKKKTKFENVVNAILKLAWIPLVYIVVYQLLQLLILKLT